jgi:hypothetical protein
MEVEIPSNEKKPLADDTSAITDVDFDHDFRGHRQRRHGRFHYRQDDNGSIGSSLISYGGLSSCVRTRGDEENIHPNSHSHPNRQQLGKSMPYGVKEMKVSSPDDFSFRERPAYSLGNRISDLEKKMGISPPRQASAFAAETVAEDNPKILICDKTNLHESFRVIGVAANQNDSSFVNSPLATPATEPEKDNGNFSPALEPTQLQTAFDRSGSPPSSCSDFREQIVMGNCNYLQESIAFMTTEDFRRISTESALVKWDRGSVSYHPNVGCEATDEGRDPQQHDNAVAFDRREESFANDIVREVETICSKYRDGTVIDAHELLKVGSDSAANDSFSTAQGKLYSA